jgi:hypothetical protein
MATELAGYVDHGSSLMNAQGYDSDAQCIGTPQQVENAKGEPRSPTRRMGLNDMIKRSQGANNLERWASASGQDQFDTPGASFGMHFVHTPPGSIKGRPAARHVKHAAESTGSRSTPSFNPSCANQRSGEQSTFAKSLPSLHVSHEELVPPNRGNAQSHTLSGSSGENLQNLVLGWTQYIDSNRNEYDAASSQSLPRPTPEIVISKIRQPTGYPSTHSETRTPYLGDLDLSHRGTEPNKASGPSSTDPSMSDRPRANRYGTRMPPQENIPSCDTSGISTIVGSESQKQAILHKRDVSSFYSRQSDEASGRASPAVCSLRIHAANVIERLPNIHGRMTGEVAFIEDRQGPVDEVVRSKFVDQLEAAKSECHQPHAEPNITDRMGSQRKVSPGWMTDGRRIGYGYNLVDNVEQSPPKDCGNDNPLSNESWDRQTPEPDAGVLHTHGMNGSVKQRSKQRSHLEAPTQPFTPDGDSKRTSSRYLPTKTPAGLNADPILTPSIWAKMKSHSVRHYRHAPLAADLAGEGMFPTHLHHAGSFCAQYGQSPAPTSVNYVEDTDGNFSSQRSRVSLSLGKQPQTSKNDEPKPGRNLCTPETSPVAGRRLSMDQTNRRPSVYFDPANERSADKLNGQPSRSRSGRWVLRFAKNRGSKKLSYMPSKKPSQGSWVPYECAPSGLERANSTRSDMAADLASEYQECIQMPGAFYGSRWASRTSLVVEAE